MNRPGDTPRLKFCELRWDELISFWNTTKCNQDTFEKLVCILKRCHSPFRGGTLLLKLFHTLCEQ